MALLFTVFTQHASNRITGTWRFIRFLLAHLHFYLRGRFPLRSPARLALAVFEGQDICQDLTSAIDRQAMLWYY